MAIHHESNDAAARGAADWLCLAAAPTFAIMALLTGVLGDGPLDMLCSRARVTAERNGPDVLADERLPFGALAEADLQPAKRRLPVLIRATCFCLTARLHELRALLWTIGSVAIYLMATGALDRVAALRVCKLPDEANQARIAQIRCPALPRKIFRFQLC